MWSEQFLRRVATLGQQQAEAQNGTLDAAASCDSPSPLPILFLDVDGPLYLWGEPVGVFSIRCFARTWCI